ncbi:hypothetical protein Cal7507_5558 [Calothrix sp. PCC 7507]|nr:hypothetical protein Cal7507_5558 [Calothrix sp. PCC 7507]
MAIIFDIVNPLNLHKLLLTNHNINVKKLSDLEYRLRIFLDIFGISLCKFLIFMVNQPHLLLLTDCPQHSCVA